MIPVGWGREGKREEERERGRKGTEMFI